MASMNLFDYEEHFERTRNWDMKSYFGIVVISVLERAQVYCERANDEEIEASEP